LKGWELTDGQIEDWKHLSFPVSAEAEEELAREREEEGDEGQDID
jgi:hypothetical protein